MPNAYPKMTAQIEARVAQKGPLVIRGVRRAGKTTLLDHARRQALSLPGQPTEFVLHRVQNTDFFTEDMATRSPEERKIAFHKMISQDVSRQVAANLERDFDEILRQCLSSNNAIACGARILSDASTRPLMLVDEIPYAGSRSDVTKIHELWKTYLSYLAEADSAMKIAEGSSLLSIHCYMDLRLESLIKDMLPIDTPQFYMRGVSSNQESVEWLRKTLKTKSEIPVYDGFTKGKYRGASDEFLMGVINLWGGYVGGILRTVYAILKYVGQLDEARPLDIDDVGVKMITNKGTLSSHDIKVIWKLLDNTQKKLLIYFGKEDYLDASNLSQYERDSLKMMEQAGWLNENSGLIYTLRGGYLFHAFLLGQSFLLGEPRASKQQYNALFRKYMGTN